jgi:hypothetical protein
MEVLNNTAFEAADFSKLVVGTSGFLIPQYYQFDSADNRYIPIIKKPETF